ncbi:uncharacterized protein J3R85_020531 [Psidium guajava]|nr:uncharacterized protein J3R85_020531 [Psidium guajava]
MVSQRQRLARKKYKEANPELFPKPEPTPPKDPTKTKKKLNKFKRKKSDPNDPRRPTKKTLKKHPLRVPGLMPGQGCFICKAQDHIAKLCPEKFQWEKNKICLLCRRRGHSLKSCPERSEDSVDRKLCYNCGETGHSLANCPQPLKDGGTKFASCFICKEQGHLSKNCPQNAHGIYPKGGCCKICGGVTHLAKDCPEKGKRGSGTGGRLAETEEAPRPQVTKFISGDDLDDDFMMDETPAKKDKPSACVADTSGSKDGHVKAKRKQGTKVVDFVG